MKTIKGHLMCHPNAVFEIKAPDGNIVLFPDMIKQLLSGEMDTVTINNCKYVADVLLDQEVIEMKRSIYDDSLLRMKTGNCEESDF